MISSPLCTNKQPCNGLGRCVHVKLFPQLDIKTGNEQQDKSITKISATEQFVEWVGCCEGTVEAPALGIQSDTFTARC